MDGGSPTEAVDVSSSSLTGQSQSDPLSSSSSSNVSVSRLNAQAAEFVPIRTLQRTTDLQKTLLVVPPPSAPPTPLPVYSPPGSPFPVQFRGHVPVVQNPHHLMVPYHSSHAYHQHRPGDSVRQQAQQPGVESGQDPNSKGKLSDEATHKILNQIEYYFSDLNLATTDHLMKFINKDPDGYVPISVVASFKKIKALISSHSQLATVLRNSTRIVVSEDGKKVRRQQPLTDSQIEDLQSRIVIAENLPDDHCHQNLMKIFSTVGSVKAIRTCPAQSSTVGFSLAPTSGKNDGMPPTNKLHAYVEYESVELAEKAVTELNVEGNWRSGLRVRLMLRFTSKSAQGRGKKGSDIEVDGEDDGICVQLDGKQSEDSCVPDASTHERSVSTGEEYGNEKEGGQRKGRNRGGWAKGRGRGQSHHATRGNQAPLPRPSSNLTTEQAAAKQPPGPRMPDGTRGFSMGRGKACIC